MKVRQRRDAAVEPALELIGADLPRQIDREGLRQRNHGVVPRNNRGVCDILDRSELEQRVVVDEIIEFARAEAKARDHPTGVQRLLRAGDDASLDQVEHALGDNIGMDAEITAPLEMFQSFIRDAAEVDLQRGAVLDDLGDVARNLLRDIVDRRMAVFGHFALDWDKTSDALNGDQRIPVRARHAWVDFGDDRGSHAQYRHHDIDRYAEAHPAMFVWRSNLHHCDIRAYAPVGDQFGDLHERDWNVFGGARAHERRHVRTDKESPMPKARFIGSAALRETGREEMKQFDVGGTGSPRLQRRNEREWRRATGSQENVFSGLDQFHGRRRGGDPAGVN